MSRVTDPKATDSELVEQVKLLRQFSEEIVRVVEELTTVDHGATGQCLFASASLHVFHVNSCEPQ
jgi:hypothetical protein